MPNDSQPNRVLVFGGSGFLGSQLLTALDDKRREVLCAARKPGERPRSEHESIRDIAVDLEKAGSAESLIRLLQPRAVILAAALARVGDCERDPEAARRMNELAPGEIARACALSKIRLIYTSTDLVFDGEPPRESGYVETDPANANSVYGRSKAAGERAVLEAHPEALVVRLPLLYGPSGQRGLGASDSLLAALAADESPGLFTDEWRTPLEASNAARALVELLEVESTGLLHLAGPDRISRHEFGRLVLESEHRQAELNRVRAVTRDELNLGDRPRDVSLDSSKALGFVNTPLLGVRDSLGIAGSA